MAWGGSGWYADTLVDALGTSQFALNLDNDTHKIALYDNTITPDFSTANQVYGATGEITGTGYTAGGAVIGSATLTVVTATDVYATWDGSDVQWTESTLTGVRGGIAYAAGETDKRLILAVDFGEAFATNDGTLLISWSSSGIGRINVVSA